MTRIGTVLLALLLFRVCGWSQTTPAEEQRLVAANEPQPARIQPAPATIPASESRVSALVALPAGTHLALRMISNLEGAELRNGERFYLVTREPIPLDSRTVLPAKTAVVGVVERDSGNGEEAADGGLLLRLNALYPPDGRRVRLSGRVIRPHHPAKRRRRTRAVGRSGGPGTSMIGDLAILGGLIGAAAGKSVGAAVVGGLAGAGLGIAIDAAETANQFRIASGTDVDAVLDEPAIFDRPRRE